MDFLEAWRSLSVRIRGLSEAGKLDALLRPGAPQTGSTAYLFQQCREIFSELAEFKREFVDTLPLAATKILDDAERLHAIPPSEPNWGLTGNALVHLLAIESALTFSLSRAEERVLSLTELALQHLQRSLIVDDTLRGNGTEHSRTAKGRLKGSGRSTFLAMGYMLSR
jgi:hypothetical protein